MTVTDAIGSDLPGVGVGGGKQRRQFGNAIVARLPVRQVLRALAAVARRPPRSRRCCGVALEAVIDTDVGPLRVISTHTEFYSETQRLAQVGAARAASGSMRARARPARAEKQDSPFADSGRR